jgi:hypothetical protein
MKKSAITGPVITLGAAAALGITLFSINATREEASQPPRPAAVVAATPLPAPTIASKPRPAQFPAKVKYHSNIPTKKGNLTLDIRVDSAKATAYACDNYGIEDWLTGSAVDGMVTMMSADGKDRVTGRHEGSTVVGNLSIGNKQWAFTAQTVRGYGDV